MAFDDWVADEIAATPMPVVDLSQSSIPQPPNDGTVVQYDLLARRFVTLGPAPDPAAAPSMGLEGVGETDRLIPDEDLRNFSSPLVLVNDPAPWPFRANCKLVFHFPGEPSTRTHHCSATLVDSRHAVTAGHCIYDTNEHRWFDQARIIPAFNNINPGGSVVGDPFDTATYPYGFADGTFAVTFQCWTGGPNNNPPPANYDCDVAIIRLDRPVGALTGWYGWGPRGGCDFFQQTSFTNRSYPADTPYTGRRMFERSGTFDSCESSLFGWWGNNIIFNSRSWGGQSGSSTVAVVNGERRVYSILSFTNLTTQLTGAVAIDVPTSNYWADFIAAATPATPDRIPLNVRAAPTQVAGRDVFNLDFLVHNYASVASSGACEFEVYLSSDRTISAGDTRLGIGTFDSAMGPKNSLRVNVVAGFLPIPPQTAAGNYYLGIVLTTPDARSDNNTVHVVDVAPIQVLEIGACCQPDGHCLAEMTNPACQAAGGAYHGNGTVCTPNPCPGVQGACCSFSGVCSLTTEIGCQGSGIYIGDFTTCAGVGQCPNTGACCSPGGTCRIASISDCVLPCEYYGNLTTCTSGICDVPPIVNCCFYFEHVCAFMTRPACVDAGGESWDFDCGTFACWEKRDAEPAPPQSDRAPGVWCCLPNGSCTILNTFSCEVCRNGETYKTEFDCLDCAADPATGACCYGLGVCERLTSVQCDNASGVFLGAGVSCAGVDCASAIGACCAAGQSCALSTEEQCTAQAGTYLGDGVDCGDCPAPEPTGACCQANAQCNLLTAVQCAALAAAYLGDGVSCSPYPCPALRGACCLLSGACILASASDCGDVGGGYHGDNSACEPETCPPIHSGACCTASGVCAVLSTFDCFLQFGDYQGDDTTCTPHPCSPPATGACCLAEGVCEVRSMLDCQGTTSLFLGDGTTCEAGVCDLPTGACCAADQSCSVRTRVECEGGGGRYDGDKTECGASTCGAGRGDMNCDGFITVSDIGGFVLALTNPAGYAVQYPNCYRINADINADGQVSVSDIGGFIALLVQ